MVIYALTIVNKRNPSSNSTERGQAGQHPNGTVSKLYS